MGLASESEDGGGGGKRGGSVRLDVDTGPGESKSFMDEHFCDAVEDALGLFMPTSSLENSRMTAEMLFLLGCCSTRVDETRSLDE